MIWSIFHSTAWNVSLSFVEKLSCMCRDRMWKIIMKNMPSSWGVRTGKKSGLFFLSWQSRKQFSVLHSNAILQNTMQLKLWESASLLIVTLFFCSQLSECFWISKSQLSILSLLCLWNHIAIFCMHANGISPFTPSSSAPDSWERRKFVRTFLRFQAMFIIALGMLWQSNYTKREIQK